MEDLLISFKDLLLSSVHSNLSLTLVSGEANHAQ